MNVLVVNAGSSTLKYQVIDTKSHKVSAKGSCERVCFTGGTFTHAANGSKKVTENIEFPDHKVAIEVVLKDLEANGVKIEGIGHRIVQGGWYFGDSSLVDEDVLAKIREVAPLAPLHNNPEANVIEYCLEQYPDLPNVTVYDTAFHFNMPEVAKTYALPKDVCDKLHIRKYGAHGTSYRYISKKVAEMTNGEARKVVVCHIGSGASLCAIEDGKCMDTTMGLTPLDGVMMGTRCGSIDPATVCYLQREGGYTFDEVDEMMNKKSGLLAVTGGKTNDCRNVEELAALVTPMLSSPSTCLSTRLPPRLPRWLLLCAVWTPWSLLPVSASTLRLFAPALPTVWPLWASRWIMPATPCVVTALGACLPRIPRSRFSSSPRTRSS